MDYAELEVEDFVDVLGAFGWSSEPISTLDPLSLLIAAEEYDEELCFE
jgi:hypothetical protein